MKFVNDGLMGALVSTTLGIPCQVLKGTTRSLPCNGRPVVSGEYLPRPGAQDGERKCNEVEMVDVVGGCGLQFAGWAMYG